LRRVAFALLVLVAAGCGGSSSIDQTERPDLKSVKKALVAQLKEKQLTFRWVACVRNGRSYRHQPIVRCNVNFGMDPHIEAYCAVFEKGRLVTNHENSAIPCGHDDAGYSAPVEGS
jgi:hypothetical protein